ncbi:hypothetical protein [Cohnella abietis]|uniref:DUF948 domain-containing protein n=1 Tax=Cohnella abietis TaxID=2507935 RepID=A0A3T1D9Y4_9BACL|nr:hypothetical protein [Cohnella abietis]BBI34883.1 hypothetical protein KCTCHS21_42820 [Cohnella abietis]
MAWDVAAYGITVAVLTIAVAGVVGLIMLIRSFRRLEQVVRALGKETEVSLRQCRQLADEAKLAIAESRKSLQGFSSLAEGARAVGDAVQAAAQTAVHVTSLYRECLTAPFQPLSGDSDDGDGDGSIPDLTQIGRKLWASWKRRSDNDHPSDCCEGSGLNAYPSQGE